MFETVEVPFKTIGNLQCLTVEQVLDEPWLAQFIMRFPNCFEYNDDIQAWIYYPNAR
jgi:hypothetical protein